MSGSGHRRGWRRSALALLAWLSAAGCEDGGLTGASAEARAAERPGRLVRLADGRNLNLRCRGHGAPTVVLEAGWGAASAAWGKVQPALASTTRVCAYDRAGSGFSDPGPLPRDGAAIVRDLDEALAKAGERGPFVLVGHSAGGLYVRLFAARRPQQVSGLVLLDPTVERRVEQPSMDGLGGLRRRVQRCLSVAEASPPAPPTDPAWSGCVPANPGPRALRNARDPQAWRNQLSELDSIYGRTSEQVFRIDGLLNAIPTYVITASESAAAGPTYGLDRPQSVLEVQHQLLAAGSRYGSQRTVLSGHLIMIERPDVVIAAVEEMVRASRAGQPPEPLAPSETTEAGETQGLPFKGFSFPENPVPTK